jgi:hypothetical protein
MTLLLIKNIPRKIIYTRIAFFILIMNSCDKSITKELGSLKYNYCRSIRKALFAGQQIILCLNNIFLKPNQ